MRAWHRGVPCFSIRLLFPHRALVPACLLPEGWSQRVEQPADLAAVLLGSLAHCLDNDAALACFRELRWAHSVRCPAEGLRV